MSVRVMSAVWQGPPYEGGRLLVLLALADWCDDDGYCWPSVPAIAMKARLSERQVQNVLAHFRETGIITVEQGSGRGHSNRYQLHLETLKPTSPIPSQKGETDCTVSADKRVKSTTERVKSTTEKGEICDIAIRKNRHEPSIEPSGKRTRTREPFRKPTLEEIAAYCQERRNGVNPQRWLNHYTANGWRVGRNPMKDWKAGVRTWESDEHNGGHGNGIGASGLPDAESRAAEEQKRMLMESTGMSAEEAEKEMAKWAQ